MKILFAGGGSGGHFYPLIAVAEALNTLAQEERLLDLELYYIAGIAYDDRMLFENNIKFEQIAVGKMRRYFSIQNFTDSFKIILGIFQSIIKVYSIYPDVVFSKGGYPSVPVLFAARLFNIPVMIHESDSDPGRANLWASKFAERIAVAFPEAGAKFPQNKVALTGNPVRNGIKILAPTGAIEFLGLEKDIPVILILGGSLGSTKINQVVMDALSILVEKYQVIHQTGKSGIEDILRLAVVVLEKSEFKNRYKPFDYLNNVALRMAAGASKLIISRAGSGSISEIATWGKPSIVIPIPSTISHDQEKNAFSYARSGSAHVIEEINLTPHILIAEIDRIMSDTILCDKMASAAKFFSRDDAARKIAKEIIDIALRHEN
jgi:UDP-N-acetylglucosamine--N-acetylmuramyl-(pentapeptide) pyrophosphoryl-undecaprenol N-acetylglucosamine transferase